MKLVQFTYKNNPNEIRVGYLQGDNVVDINKADPSIPSTLLEILKSNVVGKVKTLRPPSSSSVPLTSVILKAPILGMDKVLCVGMNYRDFCDAKGVPYPDVPPAFSKFPSNIIGTQEAVRIRTDVTKDVIWEVELTIVIGKTASSVKAADAYDYVLGYTIAQDITAMEWLERNGGHALLGKTQDTFCPIGPCIVTGDEVGDPHKLAIKCTLNGEVKQSSNTEQLIHKIPAIIERLSSLMTLLPGDIILTGTPRGLAAPGSPPQYLKPGDSLQSEIEKIGILDLTIEKF